MPPTTDPPPELVPALAAKRLLGLLHASKVDTVRRGSNFSPMRAIRDRYRGYLLVSRAKGRMHRADLRMGPPLLYATTTEC
jgi:hypothetical protein